MLNLIGWTLVDITATNVIEQTSSLERNQQRNWETVLQLVQFRTLPTTITIPIKHTGDISDFLFGSHYSGTHTVWAFKFSVLHNDLYTVATDKCSILHLDFDEVPIILNLTETAHIPAPLFFLNPVTRNIYFEIEK